MNSFYLYSQVLAKLGPYCFGIQKTITIFVGKVSFSTFEFGADFLFFFSLYFGFD
jgi:hypothetical protein